MGQYGKNQSNTDIFRIGPIPVSPITTRSESARHIDNCKEKSQEILDWLINKGIIKWCFSYWPSYRSEVVLGLLYWHSAAPQANTAGLGPITRPIWKTSRNNTIIFHICLCSFNCASTSGFSIFFKCTSTSQFTGGTFLFKFEQLSWISYTTLLKIKRYPRLF